MTAATFPRTQRIAGRGSFLPIRNQGVRVTSGPLVAWMLKSQRQHSRLGISIGRMVGNAVTRNRIKRQLREAFRTARPTRPIDLVVQVRKHLPATSTQYREWWLALLERSALSS